MDGNIMNICLALAGLAIGLYQWWRLDHLPDFEPESIQTVGYSKRKRQPVVPYEGFVYHNGQVRQQEDGTWLKKDYDIWGHTFWLPDEMDHRRRTAHELNRARFEEALWREQHKQRIGRIY